MRNTPTLTHVLLAIHNSKFRSSTQPSAKKARRVVLVPQPTKLKLGVLFLAKENGMCNVKMWEEWKKFDADIDVQFFMHDKKCPTSKAKQLVLNPYDIQKNIPTEWGTPSIVEATILLLECAKENGCSHCVLVSGDTIPLHSASDILKDIAQNPITITQYGTENGWPDKIAALFDKMKYAPKHINYHHQFFAVNKIGLDTICKNKETILQMVNHAFKIDLSGGFKPAPDEIWLNFVNADIGFEKIVYFVPDEEEMHATELSMESLNEDILIEWAFARKFSTSCQAPPHWTKKSKSRPG